MNKKRILFSGYAHVHFICFLPIYEKLKDRDDVEIYFSGGFRKKDGDEITFSEKGFYDPFQIDESSILTIDEAKQQDFDVLVSSHLSDVLFPKSATKKVQIFHGVSFKNLSVREKALKFDLLCLPGHYHAELYQKQGLIKEGGSQYLITGFPKADHLLSEFEKGSFLKGLGLDSTRPTVIFAPTGERGNALDVMGMEMAQIISRENSCNFLIKPHDHPKKKVNWFEKLSIFENDKVRIIRDKDVIPYLKASDLLITDASSVAVEYTLLDKPIIFMDVPNLLNRIAKRAPAMDMETYGRKIGTICDSPAELPSIITKSLGSPGKETEIRRKMANHLFYKPGSAVDRVINVVLYAAGLTTSLSEDIVEVKRAG